MFTDTDGEEPVATTSLAKLLASAFIVQGNHFVVLKQIHPDEVQDLHMACIDYLGRKLTTANRTVNNAKGKAAKERATTKLHQVLSFFRALVHLLGPISGKQSLSIKNHLEEVIEGVLPVGAGRQWDAYRAYEKRLGTIAGKDPNVKVLERAQKVVRDQVLEDTDDEDEGGAEQQTPTKSVPKKRKEREEEPEEREQVEEEQGAEVEAQATRGHDDEVEEDVIEAVDIEVPEVELDMDFDLDMPDTQESRERSPSTEPVVKRRRTVREI
jgi:cohesin complex subunit SA-1/2